MGFDPTHVRRVKLAYMSHGWSSGSDRRGFPDGCLIKFRMCSHQYQIGAGVTQRTPRQMSGQSHV